MLLLRNLLDKEIVDKLTQKTLGKISNCGLSASGKVAFDTTNAVVVCDIAEINDTVAVTVYETLHSREKLLLVGNKVTTENGKSTRIVDDINILPNLTRVIFTDGTTVNGKRIYLLNGNFYIKKRKCTRKAKRNVPSSFATETPLATTSIVKESEMTQKTVKNTQNNVNTPPISTTAHALRQTKFSHIRYNNLLNKQVTKTIFCNKHEILIKQGQYITLSTILHAKQCGKLIELSLNCTS